MKNIAIIPARSGSKGLPDKNIKLLAGKPLLAYSIEAAAGAEIFDEIMVSTDSEMYGEVARKWGASVPFLRSRENSSDTASSWEAVEEVLRRYEEQGRFFDTFCLLQPTSPLRGDRDIIAAYDLYREKKAAAVVSLCEVEHSPRWCNTLGEDMSLENFVDREDICQRQSLETYYRINGAIYIADVKKFKEDHFIYKKGAFAYIMDAKSSVDIDTELDFRYAETLLGYRKENS